MSPFPNINPGMAWPLPGHDRSGAECEPTQKTALSSRFSDIRPSEGGGFVLYNCRRNRPGWRACKPALRAA